MITEGISQWYGVTADAAGQVTALELGGNNLSGELPEQIGEMEDLTILDLSDNQLSGPLPEEVSNLTNLEELYLNNDQFSGPVPAGLGALTELTDLWLHDNGFGAEFPAELGDLANLESVTTWGNRYTWADSYAPGLRADMVGLVALYDATGGDGWSDKSGWLSDPSVAAWSRVSIDGQGRVTALDLSEKRAERGTAAADRQPDQPDQAAASFQPTHRRDSHGIGQPDRPDRTLAALQSVGWEPACRAGQPHRLDQVATAFQPVGREPAYRIERVPRVD